MSKTVMITGGAGFIGSHLVDKCIDLGYSVKIIDDLSVGRLSNLNRHKGNSKLTIIKADVSNYGEIHRQFQGVQWVFHLAARADIVPSIKIPLIYHRANVDGTINVLEAARAVGVERFVYTASSSCYGIPDKFPTPESSAIRPEYPYALTKYLGEQYVLHWEKVYGLPALSLRFFNVFGPRGRTAGTYGAVFGVFLAQKAHGKPFTVVGDGTQTRDFTYVTDVVNALLAAANSTLTGEVLNVGSGGTYSVNQLVALLGGEVTYIPKRPGEPRCTFADIRRIKEKLGWVPEVKFEAGVSRLTAEAEMQHWKEAPLWTPDTIRDATADWFKFLSDKP